LRRLYDFLEPVNRGAAVRAVRVTVNRIERIPAQPRLGERLPRFVPREVRRVLVAKYEIRYELTDSDTLSYCVPFTHGKIGNPANQRHADADRDA